MRLATWNINGLRARLDYLARWLQDRQPDVVGLQELKMPTEQFPHDFFATLGYHAQVHGQKSWNGVAILSREPADLTQTGLPDEDEFGSRLITARVAGDIDFTTVYCPNGKSVAHADYPHKLRWYDHLVAYMDKKQSAEQATGRRILCGDFNIVPVHRDSWQGEAADGEIFHTEEERARLQSVMDLDLSDLYRDKYPDEKAFTWWDYRGGSFYRNQGLRIDFVLGSPAIRDALQEVTIDRDYRKKQDGLTASDHAPVFVDLAL